MFYIRPLSNVDRLMRIDNELKEIRAAMREPSGYNPASNIGTMRELLIDPNVSNLQFGIYYLEISE